GNLLTTIVTRSAPELLPMLPLLAVPFGATVADTPEASAIDPEFRRMRIHDTVVDFLDATLDGPVFLVVEDVHWIDDASGELLTHLIRAASARQWTGVLTRRPEGVWALPDDIEHAETLLVHPLDTDAVRTLAIDVSERALSDHDLSVIVDRAGGNPLFAIELTRAVSRHGAGTLPDSIEGVIAKRIDQLPAAQRRLLRVASVFGREFDLGQVRAVSGASVEVGPELADVLERADASRPDTYRFLHAMYRDVAYEGLPFTQRRRLHGDVAEVIRASTADDHAVASLLSLHFSEARNHDLAWHYSELAASLALTQQATWEAAGAYERALKAARYATGSNRSDRARVAERLGELYYILGRFDDARRTVAVARRTTDDARAEVRLMRQIGLIEERRGHLAGAIRWFRRAAARIPGGTQDPDWLGIRAEVALAEAGLRTRLGDDHMCVSLATSALADAERSGRPEATALALERIHLGLVGLGEPDANDAGRRALALHLELGDNSGAARTLTNLGVEAYYESRWTDATADYLEALSLAQAAGSVVVAATAAINSAEVLSDQGDWERAMALLNQALRNQESVHYAPGIAGTTLFLAVASMRLGDLEGAERLLGSARTEMIRLGMTEFLPDLESRQLELDLLRDTASTARCDELAARFANDPNLSARVERVRAFIATSADDVARSITRLRDLAGLSDFERALNLRVLTAIDVGAPERDEWAAEIADVFAHLGVTRPPPLPTPRASAARAR
ncbi:MAG: hypothetical protein ABWZ99_08435, partial [Ilumatobacteraceae bacterium]